MTTWQRPANCQTSECAEWRQLADGNIALRSSRAPDIAITFTPGEREAFIDAVKAGELDPAGGPT